MKARCYNPKSKDYKNYGQRGIKVCQNWLDSFINFYEDMGNIPENSSLERIDNNGNYCKENCRWASRKEQARNRRNTLFYTYNNETKSVAEWADILGIKYINLIRRYQKGTMYKVFK